jgi:thiol-disulfide isomerase/thioredoxin
MEREKKNRRSPVLPMLLMGMGLIALGAALYLVLDTSRADAQEYSTTPVEVNYPAPELELTDLAGRPVSLRDLRGSVALVNLWATWCPPCKAEMPTLQSFYEKYRDEGFVIVAINDGEPPELVEPFVRDYGLTFPVWLDEEYKSEKAFNTISLPSSYVIDRQGTVRLMWIGAITRKVLEKFVPAIIKE